MLSRSVVGGAPDARATAVGLTGAASRTWVRRATRNPGTPTGARRSSTIRPTSWAVVAAFRNSCRFVVSFISRSGIYCVDAVVSQAHRMRRTLPMALVLLGLIALAARAAPAGEAASGSFVGSYRLGRPDEIAIIVSDARALVALGPGHASLQSVPVSDSGGRIRLSVPGRPGPLVFDGAIANGALTGTVAQGSVRGTFTARAGSAPELVARGVYAVGGVTQAVVDDPYGPARLVDLESG